MVMPNRLKEPPAPFRDNRATPDMASAMEIKTGSDFFSRKNSIMMMATKTG